MILGVGRDALTAIPCGNVVGQTINKLSFQTTMNKIFHNKLRFVDNVSNTRSNSEKELKKENDA